MNILGCSPVSGTDPITPGAATHDTHRLSNTHARTHHRRPTLAKLRLADTCAGEEGIENVRSRRLVEFLLFSLSKVGWHVSAACELPGRDRDTLFFKQGPMVPRAYFSIAFDDEHTQSIKMIDAPNDAKQAFLDTLSVS